MGMGLQLDLCRGKQLLELNIMNKFVAICLLASSSWAAPAAEADPQFGFPAPAPAPAPNCVTSNDVLVTQTCTPRAEEICNTVTVETEDIEYEPLCKDVVDVLCDAPPAPAPAPAPYFGKREATAEADAQVLGYPAHAVATSVKSTVRHSCREVTTQHCVDNPKIKLVPVDVEHCHTVTKVDCAPVENPIPTTKCEPVETTHVAANYARFGYF